MKIEEHIKKIIEDVLAKAGFTLHSIILFGSRARKDFDEESDYDILVIVKEDLNIKEMRELRVKVSTMLHREIKFVPFDIILKSLKNFQEEKEVVNTISNEAFLEGMKV
jgi:predicted nucleotidyltransferase